MVKITLNSESANLKLSVGKDTWTTVVLDRNGESIPLGADVLRIITSRLIGALDEPEKLELCKNLREVQAAWVLSLSECHCSIYIAKEGQGVRLYVQNAEGEIFSSFLLSEMESSLWTERLRELSMFDQQKASTKN